MIVVTKYVRMTIDSGDTGYSATVSIGFRLILENRKQIEVAAGPMIKKHIHTFLTLKLMTLVHTTRTNGKRKIFSL